MDRQSVVSLATVIAEKRGEIGANFDLWERSTWDKAIKQLKSRGSLGRILN